jgi:hypothetical protein
VFTGTTEHGAKPRQQFTSREGLRQIIIRAQFQPRDSIGFIAERGEHQYRRLQVTPNLSQYLEPVLSGHHHINNEGRVVPRERAFQSLRSAISQIDAVP